MQLELVEKGGEEDSVEVREAGKRHSVWGSGGLGRGGRETEARDLKEGDSWGLAQSRPGIPFWGWGLVGETAGRAWGPACPSIICPALLDAGSWIGVSITETWVCLVSANPSLYLLYKHSCPGVDYSRLGPAGLITN